MKTPFIRNSILVVAACAALCGQAQADDFRGHGYSSGSFNRAFSAALGVGLGIAVVDAFAAPYRAPVYSFPVYQTHVREAYFSAPAFIAYPQPQVVYAQPQVVYAQPQVVYAQPQVVYAQPQVVQLPPQVTYSPAPVTTHYQSAPAPAYPFVPGVTFGVPIQIN